MRLRPTSPTGPRLQPTTEYLTTPILSSPTLISPSPVPNSPTQGPGKQATAWALGTVKRSCGADTRQAAQRGSRRRVVRRRMAGGRQRGAVACRGSRDGAGAGEAGTRGGEGQCEEAHRVHLGRAVSCFELIRFVILSVCVVVMLC